MSDKDIARDGKKRERTNIGLSLKRIMAKINTSSSLPNYREP